MFNWFKKKHIKQQELYPGVPTTDGTNDFLDLYSKLNIMVNRFKWKKIKLLDSYEVEL